MITRFIVYGALGWIMEVIWTGMASLLRKDFRLTSTTSIWMFFIYGMAVLLEPISDMLNVLPVFARGGVYVVCIFATEYLTGRILQKADICPWDYGDCKYNINGVIRLDYAPVWFAAGLIFELVYGML